MIKDIKVGNILDSSNLADIIIGMNTAFDDVLGIGAKYANQIRNTRKVTLGTVISFDYDTNRKLHMLICHTLGKGGWQNAEQYVRYGLDYLWRVNPTRKHSIVDIGTGRVGKRDGANHSLIRSAGIAASFLPVDLYKLNARAQISAVATAEILPFKPVRMWDMVQGEVPIRLAA